MSKFKIGDLVEPDHIDKWDKSYIGEYAVITAISPYSISVYWQNRRIFSYDQTPFHYRKVLS